MAIWRLIAHHEKSIQQIEAFRSKGVIAVGWNSSGDLRRVRPRSSADITKVLKENGTHFDNAHLGGPSLWRFYDEMNIDDLVILSGAGRRRSVMRVSGDYQFLNADQSVQFGNYRHVRNAEMVDLNPETLWLEHGGWVATGENIRWTLARCGNRVKS